MRLRGLSGVSAGGIGGIEVIVRLSDARPPHLVIEAASESEHLLLPLALPIARCVRLCVGRAEDVTLPWAIPHTLEHIGGPPPPFTPASPPSLSWPWDSWVS